ncbi:MAG TPA: endolytic transglycosylase MltG, partial [Anaerolineales bacterium]
MSKKRPILLTCSVLLFTLLCLGAVLAGSTLVGLPALADRTFGPPAPGLGLRQRTYLTVLLLLRKDELTRSKDPLGTDQPFQVQLGETPRDIASRLQSEGLISDADIFRSYLVYAGLDTTLQAGKYTFSSRMTPLEIAHALQDATPTEVILNILPGWRMEEIAATLPTSGLSITPQEFKQAASIQPQGRSFLKSLPPKATLEGFLFPGSYTLPRGLSADQLIATLLDNFQSQVGSDILQGFRRQG